MADDSIVAELSDDTELSDGPDSTLSAGAVLAIGVGVALAWTARSGALPLLVTVAVLQALLVLTTMLSLRIPGRIGGILIAGLAAAAADTVVSVWPHSRLGPLLAVLGLAGPTMFVHQLRRGVSRVRLVESLGGIGLLTVAVTALPALLQLRHDFRGLSIGSDPAFAVVVVLATALVAGIFADLVYPAPRFDEHVPRGLFAVVVSTGVGGAVGQLALRGSRQFVEGRSIFIGAALGAVVALLSIAVAFIGAGIPLAESGFARRARPLLGVLVPVALTSPVAYVLCLAVRR